MKMSEVAFAVAVGVPLIRPVDEFSVSPAGNVPEVNVHVYGAVPPVAANVCEYDAPSWPFASDVVVMFRVEDPAAVTVMLSDFVAVCAVGVVESVTCTVKLDVPGAPGVPESAPDEAFKLRPAGRDPEMIDHL